MRPPEEERDIIAILEALERRVGFLLCGEDLRAEVTRAVQAARNTLMRLRDRRYAEMLRHLRDVYRLDLSANVPCPACAGEDESEHCGLCRGQKVVTMAERYIYEVDPDAALAGFGRTAEMAAADPSVVSLQARRGSGSHPPCGAGPDENPYLAHEILRDLNQS
jgi:hypothetical protein